jgi:predicted phage terminase large subunit-like protein
VRMLAGHNVKADKVTGSKEVRAEPYAAQVQAGNVALAMGAWNRDFIDEHESFPGGKYKDQVDVASGAFNKINSGSTYDSSMSLVR